MKFICLGYIDPKTLSSASETEMNAMMDSCFAYDDQLRANGNFKGGEALQPPSTAMTLRYTNGRVVVTDGPFAETKEQLGGISPSYSKSTSMPSRMRIASRTFSPRSPGGLPKVE